MPFFQNSLERRHPGNTCDTKGGSKYGVQQGNVTIWKMFLFGVFVFVGKRHIKNIYIYIEYLHLKLG